MPQVFPCNMTLSARVHRPALSSAVWKAARLATANIRPNMCSATAGAVRPGWLDTTMPSSLAAAKSIMSVPMEQVVIILSLGKARRSASRHVTAPRELMMIVASFTRSIFSAPSRGRVWWIVRSA